MYIFLIQILTKNILKSESRRKWKFFVTKKRNWMRDKILIINFFSKIKFWKEKKIWRKICFDICVARYEATTLGEKKWLLVFFALLSCTFCYIVFNGFGKAKFAVGGSILGPSQFTLLPQLPPKILIDSKVVKIDPQKNHLALLI